MLSCALHTRGIMPGAGTSKGTYDRALALVQHSQNSGVPAPSRDTNSSPRCGTVWVGGAEGSSASRVTLSLQPHWWVVQVMARQGAWEVRASRPFCERGTWDSKKQIRVLGSPQAGGGGVEIQTQSRLTGKSLLVLRPSPLCPLPLACPYYPSCQQILWLRPTPWRQGKSPRAVVTHTKGC